MKAKRPTPIATASASEADDDDRSAEDVRCDWHFHGADPRSPRCSWIVNNDEQHVLPSENHPCSTSPTCGSSSRWWTRAASSRHRASSTASRRASRHASSASRQRPARELFHRHKQRLHLSPGGEMLRGYAEKLLRLSDEASSALAGSAPRRPAAPRRAREHDRQPPARGAGARTTRLSGGEDRAHDRHQRRADGGGARPASRCRIRRRARGGAASCRTCRSSANGSSSSPPRGHRAGARPEGRGRPLGDRVPERLRLPPPALPLARRNQRRRRRASSTSARTMRSSPASARAPASR